MSIKVDNFGVSKDDLSTFWSILSDQTGLTGDKTGTFNLTTTGLGTFTGLGVGMASNITTADIVTGTTYTHQTGTRRGIYNYPVFSPAGELGPGNVYLTAFEAVATWKSAVDGSLANVFGFYGGAQTDSTATGDIVRVAAMQIIARHFGSGKVSTMYGLYSQLYNDDVTNETGNITNAYNIRAYGYTDKGTGSINKYYGLYIDNVTGGGLIANQYGIWIDDLTAGGTSNYGIVIDSDTVGLTLGADQDVTVYANADGKLFFKGLSDASDPRITFDSGNDGYIEWQEDELQFYIDKALEVAGNLKIGGNVGFYNTTPQAQSTGWSVTNASSDKVFDADATTIDKISDVLGTLIETLKGYGLLGA